MPDETGRPDSLRENVPAPTRAVEDLFVGPGVSRALCRELDWSATPLGPLASWSDALRGAVRLCLDAGLASCVFAGPDLVLLHNDAYGEVLGEKHPWALARPAREVWAEIWEEIGPELTRVLETGERIRREERMFRIRRGGALAEGYFTYAFSPIRDDAGAIVGVFSSATETTARVDAECRLREANASLALAKQHLAEVAAELRERTREAEALAEALRASESQLRDAERITRQRTERLLALTAALSEALTEAEVAHVAVDQGLQAVGADAGVLALFDAAGALRLADSRGFAPGTVHLAQEIPLDPGLPLADAILQGRPVVAASRAERDARYPAATRSLAAFDATIVLPLIGPDGVMGALGMHRIETGDLGPESLTFMEAFARQCAQALERARLHEAAQRTRAEAEAAARALHERTAVAERREGELAAILDRLPAAVWIADRAGRITRVNPGVAALWGEAPILASTTEYVEYEAYWPAGHPKAGERVRSEDWALARVLATGETVLQERVEIVRFDTGERRLVLNSSAAVRDGEGNVTGGVAVMFDITEQEAMRLEAEQQRAAAEHEREAAVRANNARTDFLANMSHELRTPLNAIAGYTEILELGIHGPITDAQRRALERITIAQRHLLSLINDVLNFVKIEAGRVEFDVRETLVRHIVRAHIPLIEPQLAAKGLHLTVSLPEDRGEPPIAVWVDPDKAGQILLNLLSNAVKFTPSIQPTGEPGRIAIELDAGDDPTGVALRVRDTGIGVPLSKQAAIFDPFVQVSTSLTRTTGGTGLGLAIARDLARGMGGDITLESVEGAGSTFTVTLRRVTTAAGESVDRRSGDDRRRPADRRHARRRRDTPPPEPPENG